ncbi:MAG: hypothetical protein Q4C42_11455 [Clostridia bacterium]|nr:hypothetical protein [Clostridia bacterium]
MADIVTKTIYQWPGKDGRKWLADIEDMAAALEKTFKYRWHDLREDPEDLPPTEGLYLTLDNSIFSKGLFIPEVLIWQTENDLGLPLGWRSNDDWIMGCMIQRDIIAWKEIEPFEEVDE